MPRHIKLLLRSFIFTISILYCDGGEYGHLLALHSTKFNNATYNPNIRPVLDQDDILLVKVNFALLGLGDVDDMSQSFTVDGFLIMDWQDEILRWDPNEYGNITMITPDVKDVWKPRLVHLNTLDERDPFKDDISALNAFSDGKIKWQPGSLLTTSCEVDVTKYPFDQQYCIFLFTAMLYLDDQLRFYVESQSLSLSRVSRQAEWEVTSGLIYATVVGKNESNPSFMIAVTMKRRPTSFVYNFLLPAIFTSILNIFVFIIPAETGEKISFGITVLLAQAVFMTILQTMVPISSLSVPNITKYVFGMLAIGVFTVLASIISVCLHHKGERSAVEKNDKSSQCDQNQVISNPFTTSKDITCHDIAQTKERGTCLSRNPCATGDTQNVLIERFQWKRVAKWVDIISFVISFSSWVTISVIFVVSILT